MKLHSIGMQGVGLLARKGLLALSFLIVARSLGPNDYGKLTYLFTWAYIFFTLSSLGFSAVTTRELARAETNTPRLFKASLLVRVGSALVGVALLSVLASSPSLFGRVASLRSALVYAWIIPAYAIADQLGAYVIAFEKHKQFATINLIQWGGFFFFTVLAIAYSPNLSSLMSFQTLGLWVGLIVACVYLRAPLSSAWSERTDYGLTRILLKEAFPLAVTNLVILLYFRLGTLFLFRYAGAEQTGIFTSASQIVEASQLIPMAVVGAVFPSICRVADDSRKLALIFEQVSSTLLFIALFVATTGTVVSLTIVRVLFGTSFSSGAPLLRLLIWTVVPTFLHYSFAYFLIAINEQRVIPISAVVGLVVSLVCNLVLVPRFGALGAVYSAAATELAICVLHFLFVIRSIKLGRCAPFLVIAVAGAGVVGLLGANWERQINATFVNVVGFCGLSSILFYSSFWVYRRLGDRVEVA